MPSNTPAHRLAPSSAMSFDASDTCAGLPNSLVTAETITRRLGWIWLATLLADMQVECDDEFFDLLELSEHEFYACMCASPVVTIIRMRNMWKLRSWYQDFGQGAHGDWIDAIGMLDAHSFRAYRRGEDIIPAAYIGSVFHARTPLASTSSCRNIGINHPDDGHSLAVQRTHSRCVSHDHACFRDDGVGDNHTMAVQRIHSANDHNGVDGHNAPPPLVPNENFADTGVPPNLRSKDLDDARSPPIGLSTDPSDIFEPIAEHGSDIILCGLADRLKSDESNRRRHGGYHTYTPPGRLDGCTSQAWDLCLVRLKDDPPTTVLYGSTHLWVPADPALGACCDHAGVTQPYSALPDGLGGFANIACYRASQA